MQESFIKLATAGDLPRVRDLKAYLFRIAGNLATDHQRAQRRRASLAAELAALQADLRGHTAEREVLAEQELEPCRVRIAHA